MRTETAPTIYLKDYTPPKFSIRDVHLNISLHPTETTVTSALTIVRNAGTDEDTPLILDGDELKLKSVSLNGKPLKEEEFVASPQLLELRNLPDAKMFKVEIVTQLAPSTNTKLMGLYQSKGVFCTQCEAEGFRRITYFMDRPDILSVYTVRLEADRADCPVLLANGNPVKKGRLPNGRHFAIWHDPHPKPCYLFALVGGDLDSYNDKFKTASKRKVKLKIYVETGKAELASFAMDALKRSMVWDEVNYGREYDLDVFNIVAVSDFNMGAMENKGLNIFNDKYVLADQNTATDADYMNIEAIIAHEYFHNWTGNRITCRDWFQLCLKEGLTVYRDQEFSSDERSRAVQRIQQVRVLKSGQFGEDSGPLAHPVRPSAYREINNFYTATVYQKGAELVRMLATIAGPENYRKATDLYFEKHDGRAAVVEDWLESFETVLNKDLSHFAKWYEQAGTPQVKIEEKFKKSDETYNLTFTQSIPDTPGQTAKEPVPIPIRFGLISEHGDDITVSTDNSAVVDDVIVFDQKELSIEFKNVSEKPVPSMLRGFSAPVILDFKESDAAKLHRGRYDKDLYNRWEALNSYALDLLTNNVKHETSDTKSANALCEALTEIGLNDALEPAFKAQVLKLPDATEVARSIGRNVDPVAVFSAHRNLEKQVGKTLGVEGMKTVRRLHKIIKNTDDHLSQAATRSLKNALLPLLTLAKVKGALEFTVSQYKNAETLTDRLASLSVVLLCQNDRELTEQCLADFYNRYQEHDLVLDKWFSLQATLPGARGLKLVKDLTKHKDFSLGNPNRARALIAPFVSKNLTAFHHQSGSGYEFLADRLLQMDEINPQVAARLLTLMNNWKLFDKTRKARASEALRRIASKSELSRDIQEIVDKMLD